MSRGDRKAAEREWRETPARRSTWNKPWPKPPSLWERIRRLFR